MIWIDIIIVVALVTGLLWGLMKGFFKQLASIVGLVAGLLVARALYGIVGEKLAPQMGMSVNVAQVISFAAIWVIIPMVLHIVASVLTKALRMLHLGFINRVLGGALGTIVAALWVSVAVQVVEFIDADNTLIDEALKQASMCYYPAKQLAELFMPAIKQVTDLL